MKHFLLILLIFFVSLNLAQAQYKSGSGLLIFNVGWTIASPDDIEADLNGNTFSMSYEKTDFMSPWSGGFLIAYSNTYADSLNAEGSKMDRLNKVSYEVIPVSFFGKYYFGSERFRGYLGAGFGIQFSNINYFTENGQITAFETGLLVSGMAGVNLYLSGSLLFNANYSISYLGNSYYQNSLAQNVNLGIGFQLD